jgi:hypothetical protein
MLLAMMCVACAPDSNWSKRNQQFQEEERIRTTWLIHVITDRDTGEIIRACAWPENIGVNTLEGALGVGLVINNQDENYRGVSVKGFLVKNTKIPCDQPYINFDNKPEKVAP